MKSILTALIAAWLMTNMILAQAANPPSMGVYIWNSEALLDPASQAAELAHLKRYGITDLYVGLNAQQAAVPTGTKMAIASLMSAARSHGMQVSLLLGDPQWILPKHRPALLALIDVLADLRFKALLLDIEVEQLQTPDMDSRVRLWSQTLNQVQQHSKWPVITVSHWRWFASEEHRPMCQNVQGLQRASLMIYSTNLDVIRARMATAQEKCPATAFSLSQSVETFLEPQETWANKGSFSGIVNRLTHHLEGLPVRSIDWQDWNSLKALSE
jgi:hypothetical protein